MQDPSARHESSPDGATTPIVRAAPPTRPGSLGVAPVVWPKPVGIISMVLGVLGAISALWQAGSMFFMDFFLGFFGGIASVGGGGGVQNQMDVTRAAMNALKLPFIATYVLTLACSVVLFVAGLATLRRQASAARLHMTYAVMRILLGVVQLSLQLVMQKRIMEATLASQATPMPAGMGGFVQAMQYVGFAIGLAFVCAYPIFVLIWFRRRVVREEVARWGMHAASR